MTTGTQTGRKPAAKKATSPPIEEATQTEIDEEPDDDIAQATGEKVFASADDLDDDIQSEDVLLPIIRKYVNVRVLEGPELARLESLPQYSNVADLIEKLGIERAKDSKAEVDTSALAEENAKYLAAVCHVSVRKPGETEAVFCDQCKYAHVPSLWRFSQTLRLHQVDVGVIADVALSAGYARALRPFWKDATLSDTSTPASSGE